MKTEYKEFIGIYRNLFPPGYCQHLIEEFNRLEEFGVGANRQDGEGAHKHDKDDYQIVINVGNHNLKPFRWTERQNEDLEAEFERDPSNLFFDGLQRCYDEYSSQYSILKSGGSLRGSIMKMQRTGPGGGYHVWHAEQSGGTQANRAIVYALYLNDLKDQDDGGETEFLYQKLRIKPEENMMIFWPAAYTHAHRGNPVLKEANKYIVTGWFYYD